MTTTYLLIAVFAVWSAQLFRSTWRAAVGVKLTFASGHEVCMAAFTLSAFHLATKILGWS
jgi:hypothetical protein